VLWVVAAVALDLDGDVRDLEAGCEHRLHLAGDDLGSVERRLTLDHQVR